METKGLIKGAVCAHRFCSGFTVSDESTKVGKVLEMFCDGTAIVMFPGRAPGPYKIGDLVIQSRCANSRFGACLEEKWASLQRLLAPPADSGPAIGSSESQPVLKAADPGVNELPKAARFGDLIQL